MSSSSSPQSHHHHEHTPEERNAEIWSTRVQRELLALTTDDAEASEQTRAMLPPFVSVKEHQLDITQATCTVSFLVDIKKGEEEPKHVVVQMDVSLPKKSDGSIDPAVPSYPFVEPIATLLSGQENFPEGSTIRDGDRLGMDLEWTPSLHLSDAVVNVALKIKESLLQMEPFHPAPEPKADAVDEVAMKARWLASSLTQKASKLGKAFSPPKLSPSGSSPSKKKNKKRSPSAAATTPTNVSIGDEINLLEEPWVDAHGVFSCKAIRRPDFIKDAMELAEEKADQESLSSPTAMFRSFAKSARGAFQESFLMVTETHILEIRTSKLNMSTATVTFCIAIELMHKLKFRRHESVSLFFKPAPDDPLIYMCPDSGDAVHQIQAVLKRHGVKGKHTNAAAHRAIGEAMQLVQEIQTKELALKHDPSVERVNEIMDLYRQAAERFEVAGDIRHEEVVTHMRKFLALPLTTSILDGSYQKPESPPKPPSPSGSIPEGEVLERTQCQLEDHDDLDAPKAKKENEKSDKEFEESMDNILKEAQEDLEKLKVDGEGDSLETGGTSEETADGGLVDMAADLDAMMKEADAELSALLKS